MAYLEPEAYSENCQTSMMECFAKKNIYLAHLKKFLYFRDMELSRSSIKKFLILSRKKSFHIFQETELSYISGNTNPEETSYIFSKESCSYISGNRNPEKFFIFQETKISYISLIFQDVTFRARKMKKITFKKTHTENISYISGNGTFLYFQGY